MSTVSSSLAFVFPGQGSQAVGMLAELAAVHPIVRETFSEASEGAGIDLWTLSQEGPEAELNRTEFTQPALLAAGIAVWRAWNAVGGSWPALLAGHSLGEYSALVAAGALSLHDAAGLVRERGRLMQDAVPAGVGAMAAVLGADDALIAEICEQVAGDEIVAPANYNSPGQTVIARPRGGGRSRAREARRKRRAQGGQVAGVGAFAYGIDARCGRKARRTHGEHRLARAIDPGRAERRRAQLP